MRIGIVGFGFIGRHLYQRLMQGAEPGLSVAFVWNRSPGKIAGVPLGLILRDLAEAPDKRADLIVELAHPDVTRAHGTAFVAAADYLVTSVTALADDSVRGALLETAMAHKRRIFVPHGALVGLDTLTEQRHRLAEVTITFKKHPKNLDFAASGIDPAIVQNPTVLYDGPARGIATLFPRNINTMITCALATVGLDRCRAVLIADPALDKAYAQVEAIGHDGSRIATWNEQPATGVSGNDMLASIIGSVRAAAGKAPGLAFV
ncbi:MAG: aspartate dehydrogenase domain-containing protein [Alphaproteobacteria bacterium]